MRAVWNVCTSDTDPVIVETFVAVSIVPLVSVLIEFTSDAAAVAPVIVTASSLVIAMPSPPSPSALLYIVATSDAEPVIVSTAPSTEIWLVLPAAIVLRSAAAAEVPVTVTVSSSPKLEIPLDP